MNLTYSHTTNFPKRRVYLVKQTKKAQEEAILFIENLNGFFIKNKNSKIKAVLI